MTDCDAKKGNMAAKFRFEFQCLQLATQLTTTQLLCVSVCFFSAESSFFGNNFELLVTLILI